MKGQRLLELDSLRGVAALGVVCYHYFYHYDEIYGHETLTVNWSHTGMLGVQLFFMVSGFVIFWTINRIEKPFDFIVSRFSRLYPAYICAVIITFIIVSYFGLPGREVALGDAVLNLLMFQEYLKVPHVDGVYWTLTVELAFYFWMFTLYFSSNLDKAEILCSLLILISILNSIGIIDIPSPVYRILLLKYVPFFTAGICFYKIINQPRNLNIIILLFSLISTSIIYSVQDFYVFSIFYGVFYLSLAGRMKFLSYRPLVFMGGISYSLYLLHQNIGYVIINKFYENQWSPLIAIFLSTLLSVLLATLMSKFVEIRCLKYIRYKYENSNKIQFLAKKITPFKVKL